MNLALPYPFSIGCTSYVIPDDILPNVIFMAPHVDDIELVLFESENQSNIPDQSLISSLQKIAVKEDITFSIHLPIDMKTASGNSAEQKHALATVTAILSQTTSLPVSGYILHFEGITSDSVPGEIREWHTNTINFCKLLLKKEILDPAMICIENLSYPPDLHEDIVHTFQFSNCLDVGHLWLQQIDWERYIAKILPSTRIIHLHGVTSKAHDHHSLHEHREPEQIPRFLSLLQDYHGVCTIEVFSESDTFQSLALIEELWQQLR